MFLHDYFWNNGSRDAPCIARFSLIPVLKLYLRDFLNRTFSGENAKNHAFCGGEKLNAAAVYPTLINQGAALRISWLFLRNLHHSPGRAISACGYGNS
jgi:hypothetical protein